MNPEFEKRHKQALDLLAILSKQAEERHHPLVFLGGSAVQAILRHLQRLSIDLDLSYTGEVGELLETLQPEYTLEKRPTQPTDLFDFYKATKQGVLVKIDIARFPLASEGETPYEERSLQTNGGSFKANVAKPSYLLAAKLVNTAVGATGRKDFEPLTFLKDVFDANALIDDFGTQNETWRYVRQINDIQNRIRKTSFTLQQTIHAAKDNLLKCVPTTESTGTIAHGTYQNFGELLFTGGAGIRDPQLSSMAYRLAAYLTALEKTGEYGAPKAIAEIEEKATHFKDRAFIDKCINELAPHGIPSERLGLLKIIAPKALIYLHACFPEERRGLVDGLSKATKDGLPAAMPKPNSGSITTDTPGVYNSRFG